MMVRLFCFSLSMLLVTCSVSLHAEDVTDPYDRFRGDSDRSRFDFDDSGMQTWTEQREEIPPVSLQALKQARIDHGPIGATVHIDTQSIRVNNGDRMVRYWVAIKSGGAVSSLNYEGLRCGKGEYKAYAYASPRSSTQVIPLKNPRWRPVRHSGSRDFHHELAKNYLCTSSGEPRSIDGIMASLQGGYGLHTPYSQLLDSND
jgi:hypothetical protein